MKRIVPALLALAAAGAATAESANPKAVIKTDVGDITLELFADKAPETVRNFIGLATGTKTWRDPKTGQQVTDRPLYSGVKFHRTKEGFMIQGGDPAGTGGGDVGFTIKGEVAPDLRFDRPGRLAMANKGGDPSSAGSQFFITDVETPFLNPGPNGQYAIFGQVLNGLDVVKKIAQRPSQPGSYLALDPVTIQSIEIVQPSTTAADPATTGSK
jgi:peptidyl-prolyl cis-trans isomerase A (cyclophilin A)